MTENGHQQVVHWIEEAIASMKILSNRLNECKGFMLMDKYNWLLLDVRNRATKKGNVLVQNKINKVVNKCRELGLITSHNYEADRSHYLQWAKYLGNFLFRTRLGLQSMRSCPVCTLEGSYGNMWQNVLEITLVDKDRRTGHGGETCHAMYKKGTMFNSHLRKKDRCMYHRIVRKYLETMESQGTKLWFSFNERVNLTYITKLVKRHDGRAQCIVIGDESVHHNRKWMTCFVNEKVAKKVRSDELLHSYTIHKVEPGRSVKVPPGAD